MLSLDWSEAACKNGIPILKLLEYPQAVKNTRDIGELMAKYILIFYMCKILRYNKQEPYMIPFVLPQYIYNILVTNICIMLDNTQ